MSENSHALFEPTFFDFINLEGSPCRGADQLWFEDRWQQRAGCGPTTAATCLAYLAHRNQGLAALSPQGRLAAQEFVSYMDDVWQHVTPTKRGLHSLELYWKGCLAFAQERGCLLSYQELDIGGKHAHSRPDLSRCKDFILSGLDHDLPIAFLNFSNGLLKNLDSWHWVPIIGATKKADGNFFCRILDEGQEREIDFSLWHRSTFQGGGLVTLGPHT